MSFVDFEFSGHKLSDFGCMVCTFNDEGLKTVAIGSELAINTINKQRTNKFKLTSTKYESPYSTIFQVCKHVNPRISGNNQYFTDTEVTRMERWLHKKCYRKFKPIREGENKNVNMFHIGTFKKVDVLKLGGEIVGLELTFVADAPFGYYDFLEYEMDFSDITNEFHIYDISDEVGYIYPHKLEITILEDGDLEIMNSQENKYVSIKNCVAGEVITLDGENKLITSDKAHATLHNDFNYNFVKVMNTCGDMTDYYADDNEVENNLNIYTVSLPCTISLSYTPICKMGV